MICQNKGSDYTPLLIKRHYYTFTILQQNIYRYKRVFQLAIVCLSFAEYVVEAFTDECAPTPIAVKVVCLTCVG